MQRLEFAQAAGAHDAHVAAIGGDAEEAMFVKTGGSASIAGGVVAGLDANLLAGEPGGVLGEIARRSIRLRAVRCDCAEFAVESDEDRSRELLAAKRRRGLRQFAAAGGGDRIERGRKGGVVQVDANAD